MRSVKSRFEQNTALLDRAAALKERPGRCYFHGHRSSRGQFLADGPGEEFRDAKPKVGANLEQHGAEAEVGSEEVRFEGEEFRRGEGPLRTCFQDVAYANDSIRGKGPVSLKLPNSTGARLRCYLAIRSWLQDLGARGTGVPLRNSWVRPRP